VVELTGSTQNDLSAKVRSGNSKHGEVLVAEFQSSGRGRLERSFEAPPQSALLFSFFVCPTRDSDWGFLPLIAGLAVSKAINTKLDSNLKWPNDVLINEKKVSGLLSEKINDEGVVIGIGINVNLTTDDLPVPSATSLAIEGWANCDRNELLVAVLTNFANLFDRWNTFDETLLDEYEATSSTIGKKIEVVGADGGRRKTSAHGLDPSGALIIDGGQLLSVGDVIHIVTN